MKNLFLSALLSLLMTGTQFVTAQNATRTTAPENPQALSFLASHFGYLGPVKTVYNMNFDKQGRLIEITGDEAQSFTYLKDKIIVKKFGSIFHYTLNSKNQITGFTIEGSTEKGTYTYDANGNLIEEKSIFTDNTDHYTYAYDTQNRVISKTTWWEGSPNRVDEYEYYGEPNNLVVVSMIKDDSSSGTKYYYKNGVLQDYVYEYSGISQMQEVKEDKYGNVISYMIADYEEEDDDGVSPFTYY